MRRRPSLPVGELGDCEGSQEEERPTPCEPCFPRALGLARRPPAERPSNRPGNQRVPLRAVAAWPARRTNPSASCRRLRQVGVEEEVQRRRGFQATPSGPADQASSSGSALTLHYASHNAAGLLSRLAALATVLRTGSRRSCTRFLTASASSAHSTQSEASAAPRCGGHR